MENSILFNKDCPEGLRFKIDNIVIQKLFVCNSKEEKDKIIESAENLFLQYLVKKYNEKLWHVTIVLG